MSHNRQQLQHPQGPSPPASGPSSSSSNSGVPSSASSSVLPSYLQEHHHPQAYQQQHRLVSGSGHPPLPALNYPVRPAQLLPHHNQQQPPQQHSHLLHHQHIAASSSRLPPTLSAVDATAAVGAEQVNGPSSMAAAAGGGGGGPLPASTDGRRPEDEDDVHGEGASSSNGAGTGGKKRKERQVLRRNMACHQCRRRKLKCDSLRPKCTPCARAEASYLCSLPPGMEPPDRAELDCLCTYDEMSGPFRKPPPPTAAGAATATTPAASAGTGNSGPTSPTTPTSSQGGSGGVARRENGRKERRGSSQVGPSAKGKGRASDGDDAPTTLELENIQLKRQLEQLRQLQAFLPQQHRSLPHEYGQGPLPQTRVPYANGSTAAPYHFPPVVPSTHASGYVYPPYGQQPTPQGERAYLWGEPNVVPPSQGSATSPQTQFYPPAPVSFSSRPGSYQGHQGSSNSGTVSPQETPSHTLHGTDNDRSRPRSPPSNQLHSPQQSFRPIKRESVAAARLPPLLHPLLPLPGDQPESHLHYPFVDKQQRAKLCLPPIEIPRDLSNSPAEHNQSVAEADKARVRASDPIAANDPPPMSWDERFGTPERTWHTLGGPDNILLALKFFAANQPLITHCWPPFDNITPSHPVGSSLSRTLFDRARLPPSDPLAFHPSLALALMAVACRNSPSADTDVWAAEAAREIGSAKLAGVVWGGRDGDQAGRDRSRRAMDVVQSACCLVAYYHMNGRWSEVGIYAPVAFNLVHIFGMDCYAPERLPEYETKVLYSAFDEEEAEERRRCVEMARFCGLVVGVFSGRGIFRDFDVNKLGYSSLEQMVLQPISLSLQSLIIISRVDSFNRELVPPSTPHGSLLSNPTTLAKFKELEIEVDQWIALLGRIAGDSWAGEKGIGELLGGKVLAEHARVLLYYVHLDHSSSNLQRKACLSAAQSISQSCVFGGTLAPLIIPSYCLHCYFLAAQVLLRFHTAAEAHGDIPLGEQLSQQITVIDETFERLSGIYPIARNLHQLLDNAIREGSAVIPRSFSMVWDAAFWASPA